MEDLRGRRRRGNRDGSLRRKEKRHPTRKEEAKWRAKKVQERTRKSY